MVEGLCAGVALREPHQNHGRPSQPRYGQKRRGGHAVPHQAEQRVIKAVTQMKGQGLGLRQIARLLTQMGVPTKCRGKGWHPEMVNSMRSALAGSL